MAIEYEDMRSIFIALKEAATKENLLILGDALIHICPQEYAKLAETVGFKLASVPKRLDPLTVGASLGFSRTETLDINGKASLTVNLHDEPPSNLMERFDCLIDAGVLFWCFDPAAALKSILKMTRPGGLIIHITAVSGHYGRGYYNIHPLLFEDFYLRNNCEFVRSSFRTKFNPQGLLGFCLSLFGRCNTVSYNFNPGNVYLSKSRVNEIRFANAYRKSADNHVVPNNVLGLFIFRKIRSGMIEAPVRSTPYDKDEVEQ